MTNNPPPPIPIGDTSARNPGIPSADRDDAGSDIVVHSIFGTGRQREFTLLQSNGGPNTDASSAIPCSAPVATDGGFYKGIDTDTEASERQLAASRAEYALAKALIYIGAGLKDDAAEWSAMTGVTIWPADVAKAPATVPDAEKDPEPPSDSSYSSDSEDEGYSGDAEESDGQPIDAERNTILTEFCGISVGRPGDSARKRPRIRDDIPIASDTRTKAIQQLASRVITGRKEWAGATDAIATAVASDYPTVLAASKRAIAAFSRATAGDAAPTDGSGVHTLISGINMVVQSACDTHKIRPAVAGLASKLLLEADRIWSDGATPDAHSRIPAFIAVVMKDAERWYSIRRVPPTIRPPCRLCGMAHGGPCWTLDVAERQYGTELALDIEKLKVAKLRESLGKATARAETLNDIIQSLGFTQRGQQIAVAKAYQDSTNLAGISVAVSNPILVKQFEPPPPQGANTEIVSDMHDTLGRAASAPFASFEKQLERFAEDRDIPYAPPSNDGIRAAVSALSSCAAALRNKYSAPAVNVEGLDELWRKFSVAASAVRRSIAWLAWYHTPKIVHETRRSRRHKRPDVEQHESRIRAATENLVRITEEICGTISDLKPGTKAARESLTKLRRSVSDAGGHSRFRKPARREISGLAEKSSEGRHKPKTPPRTPEASVPEQLPPSAEPVVVLAGVPSPAVAENDTHPFVPAENPPAENPPVVAADPKGSVPLPEPAQTGPPPTISLPENVIAIPAMPIPTTEQAPVPADSGKKPEDAALAANP